VVKPPETSGAIFPRPGWGAGPDTDQEGYGAFTVSASPIGAVINYIAIQYAHHRKKAFQEKYLEYLIQSGVEYGEKYLR
jgi:hypothetical protein